MRLFDNVRCVCSLLIVCWCLVLLFKVVVSCCWLALMFHVVNCLLMLLLFLGVSCCVFSVDVCDLLFVGCSLSFVGVECRCC